MPSWPTSWGTEVGPARETRRDLLFDYATRVVSWTVDDAAASLGFTVPEVNKAVHDVRDFLGVFDDVNLICNPNGKNQRWVYELVGTLGEAQEWFSNRIGDAETRVRTIQSVLASYVTGTSGRTTDGKKARTMHKQLTRLVEDLDEIAS